MIQILIVSDHPVVRAGFEAMLRAPEDFQVVGEANLSELPTQVESLRPDIVLLDLAGDDPDSLEALWQLSAEMPNGGIIVLSRHPGEAQARQALQAGARGYLRWDVSSEEVICHRSTGGK